MLDISWCVGGPDEVGVGGEPSRQTDLLNVYISMHGKSRELIRMSKLIIHIYSTVNQV